MVHTLDKVRDIALWVCTLLIDLCVILVYQKRGCVGIVSVAAKKSILAAVDEVKALPHYSSKGEVCVQSH